MGASEPGMPHAEAAGRLRQEVIGTLRHETGSLVDEAKFFGAVRAIMCDIDYVAALFAGWDVRISGASPQPRSFGLSWRVCFPRPRVTKATGRSLAICTLCTG
jgi:hypothetical protein